MQEYKLVLINKDEEEANQILFVGDYEQIFDEDGFII